MSNEMISFIDFFDIYNIKHIQAYRHFCLHFNWPPGFFPDHVEPMTANDIPRIHADMAVAWCDAAYSGHIYGMPAANQ